MQTILKSKGYIRGALKKFIYLLSGNVVPQAIVAVSFLWLAKAIGKFQFAQIMLLESMYQGLLIVVLFGMDKALERLSFESETDEYANKLLSSASLLSMVFGALILAGYALVDFLMDVSGNLQLQPTLVYLVIVAAITGALFQLNVSYNYVLADARTFAVLRSLRALIFSVILITAVALSASSVVAGKILADVFSFIVPILFFRFCVKSKKNRSRNVDIAAIKKALPYSAPFVITLISSFVVNYVDRFFIVKYVDAQSLAEYALAQRISIVVILVAGGATLLVPPLFYKKIETEAERVYVGIQEVMQMCFWLCIMFICLTPLTIGILYGSKYEVSSTYVPFLLVGAYLSIAVSNSTVLCLLHEKKSSLTMITLIISAVLSLSLNYCLAPVIGAYGAIIAYLASISGLYFIQYFMVRKRYSRLPIFHKQFIFLLLLSSGVSYLLSIYGNLNMWLSVVFVFLSLMSVGILFVSIRKSTLINT